MDVLFYVFIIANPFTNIRNSDCISPAVLRRRVEINTPQPAWS